MNQGLHQMGIHPQGWQPKVKVWSGPWCSQAPGIPGCVPPPSHSLSLPPRLFAGHSGSPASLGPPLHHVQRPCLHALSCPASLSPRAVMATGSGFRTCAPHTGSSPFYWPSLLSLDPSSSPNKHPAPQTPPQTLPSRGAPSDNRRLQKARDPPAPEPRLLTTWGEASTTRMPPAEPSPQQ